MKARRLWLPFVVANFFLLSLRPPMTLPAEKLVGLQSATTWKKMGRSSG